MNRITERTLSVSLIVLLGTAFLGGCGPEMLDNQANDSAMINAADSKAANEDEDEVQAPAPTKVEMAKPAMRMVAPTATVQYPTRYVRLPSEAQTQQETQSFSNERREAIQDVLIQKNIHVFQPHVNKHLIQNHLTVNRKHHTTTYLHPSYRNEVAATSSVSETDEELPATVVNAPTSYIGGYTTIGMRPGCARWFSGGFFRNCGPVSRAFPVVGPYYR